MATRIITAAVGIIVAICVLFLSDTIFFNIAISIVSVIIIQELFRAEKCHIFKSPCAVCYVFVALMPFMTMTKLLNYRWLLAIVCIMLLFLTYLAKHKTLSFDKLSFMITTSTLVSLSMSCLISIKDLDNTHGVFYLILTFGGAWIADSGAYFIGTFFGRHKLAPEISPKKTIEGAVGGIVITGIVMAFGSFIYMKYQEADSIFFDVNYVIIVVLGMSCAVLGILGDLCASLLKRQCQIKDYGNIMPGHGGMLDRFDSVLFVAPFMNIMLAYIKLFN